MQTIIYILPEIFLTLAIMSILMIGVFVKKSFKLVNLLTILSLVLVTILVISQPNETIKIINESYIIDNLNFYESSYLLILFICFNFIKRLCQKP